MTGLHVVEINVHVGGVTFAPAAEEKAAEPEEKPAQTAEKPAGEQEENAAE